MMPAPKGHKYTVGNNGGRPESYSDPEVLKGVINDYFSECIKVDDNGDAHFQPTMTGLARRLGLSRETLVQYGKKEKFSDTIKEARLIVQEALEDRLYASNVAGVIFNLKNNFGWADKQEIEMSEKVQDDGSNEW